jgi:EAL domain-containing protein (putative c-di-GMP-specific phosphodiesterase class I)/GGDEF domain-containing protein
MSSSFSIERELLATTLPELALLVKRDGSVLSYLGGQGLKRLRPEHASPELKLSDIWPAPLATLVLQLVRKAIAARETLEAEVEDAELRCEVQVTPQSRDRAICVLRAGAPIGSNLSNPARAGEPNAGLDRRGFLRRFKQSMSVAALSETPVALALIQVDGLLDISRALDTAIAERAMTAALKRVASADPGEGTGQPSWYMGQLAENLFVVALETSEREYIDARLTAVCDSLRIPVEVGDSHFYLTPYAGVAILGRDATSPKALMERARAAAVEARRTASSRVCFFSDTLKLRSLARLDVSRELQEAIQNRCIRLRYAARHDLKTGKLVAVVAYLQWVDAVRGIVRPAEFLRVAEATGASTALSRSLLECLQEDFATMRPQLDPQVRISFGALRHHLLGDTFASDINSMLSNGVVPADRLELRIAERAYVSRDVRLWHALADTGIQLVVDEFGRQVSSLDLLARAPLWGIQLDRSWVAAAETDDVARSVCRAVIHLARGLNLTPIASGIDNVATAELLAGFGCEQGLGDLYSSPAYAGAVEATAAQR